MIPTFRCWKTTSRSARLLAYFTAVLLITLGIPDRSYGVSSFKNEKTDILKRLSTELVDPEGREFFVRWEYSFEGNVWSGYGTLQILGKDLLKLTLPDQVILIRGSMVQTWYRETDQVIIDYFDPSHPSNIFSFLLGDFSGYSIFQSESLPDSTVNLKLVSETMAGFEELELLINQRTWLPVFISANAGDDMKVTINILETKVLQNRAELKSATLKGNEIIDLRE